MSHLRKLVYSLSITLIVIFLFIFLTSHSHFSTHLSLLTPTSRPRTLSGRLKAPPSQSKTVDIVARVGGYYAISSITGWASPFAEVSLSYQSVARKTTADEVGFFVFNSVSLPDDPKELCLISQDVNQLPSFPLCLAPPPRNQNIEIQDVLLSPTLSLDNGKILRGKTTKASGMTVPDSKVEVYLFTEKNFSFWAIINNTQLVKRFPFLLQISNFVSLITYHLSPIKTAFAANFPIYETKSNKNGYFEFSLPASSPSNNRLFVSSVFSPPPLPTPRPTSPASELAGGQADPLLISHPEFLSPKSNTLSFQVIGLWELFKRFLQTLFGQAKLFLPNWNDQFIIILIEILILIGLLTAVIAKKEVEKNPRQSSKNLS